tara:strand:- start:136 stop:525 length:390 start_codon:yes stop_codon:yes gene_type:complete
MKPEQRQMIKEAYQEGYQSALNEAPNRNTLRFLARLATRIAKEMNFKKQGFTLNKKGNIIDPLTGKEIKTNKYTKGNVLDRRAKIRRKIGQGPIDSTNPDLDTPIDDVIDTLKKQIDDAGDTDLDTPIG